MLNEIFKWFCFGSDPSKFTPPKIDDADHDEKIALYNSFTSYREYLIENEDQSRRQLDQLVFYISSAAFGISLTQITPQTDITTLWVLFFACIFLITNIGLTFYSILLSTNSFELIREDLDVAQVVPFKKSKTTTDSESRLSILNKAQLISFTISLLLMLGLAASKFYFVVFRNSESNTENERLSRTTSKITHSTTKNNQKVVGSEEGKEAVEESDKRKLKNRPNNTEGGKGVKPKPPPPPPPPKPKPLPKEKHK